MEQNGAERDRGVVTYCVRDVGGFSGSRQSPLDWLRALSALEMDPVLVTRSARPGLGANDDLPATLRWARIKKRTRGPRWVRRVVAWATLLWRRIQLGYWRSDVVIVEGRNGFKFARYLGLRGRRTTALMVRGQPDQYSTEVADKDRFAKMKEAIEHCDSVIFNAPRMMRMWQEAVGLEGKRTLVVANAAREREIEAIRARSRNEVRDALGLDREATIVLCLASMQRRKGQDVLVDAWPRVRAEHPDAQLHLVGPIAKRGDGVLLAERAAKLEGVEVTGPRRDALEYIYAADILVLPSRGESMPRVILEAMALGTPVISTPVGAVPDMIEHDTSGLIFETDDVSGAAQAISSLVAAPERRARLAEQARTDYWKNYSREHQRQQLNDVVAALLEHPQPAPPR